jgi:hypothetical protein
MGAVTIVEIVVVLGAVYGVYRLLAPLQRRLEAALLRLLDPNRPQE